MYLVINPLPELVLIFEADTMGHLLEIRDVFKRVAGEYPEIAREWENDVAISP